MPSLALPLPSAEGGRNIFQSNKIEILSRSNQCIVSSHLHYRPVVRLAQQLDDGRDAIVQPHGVLGQFSVLMAGREVAEGTYGWLSNILLLSGTKHSVN